MKRILLTIGLFSLFFFFSNIFLKAADANNGCPPSGAYGQGCPPSGAIVINKTVKNPSTGLYVENLQINDPRFSTDHTVHFQLTVTNTTSAKLQNITVKDTFPQFLLFVSGPGSFDSNTKTLTFLIDSLNVGESKTFDVKGKIVSESQLMSQAGVFCVINQVTVQAGEKGSQDTAQLCIEKKVLGVTKGGIPVLETKGGLKTSPPTGPELLGLLALLPGGLLGHILRRKSKSVKKSL